MMPSNLESANHLNLLVEEGSTQTDFSSMRDVRRRDSAFENQCDFPHNPPPGLLCYSRNYFLQLICSNLHDIMSCNNVHRSTQTYVNPFVSTGEKLARDVVFYFLQEELDVVQSDKLSLCLRSLVKEMLRKHDLVFTRMVSTARITPATAQTAFTEVMNHLFNPGGVSWGRIVASYAFACRLALFLKERNMCSLSRTVPLFMKDCIQEKIAPFVEQQGGWEQLCVEFPPEENVNTKLWRYFLMSSVLMGMVAVGYSFTRLQTH